MLGTRKPAQVGPKLRDQDLGGTPTNPGDGIKQLDRSSVFMEPLLNFSAHALHGFL